MSFIVSRAFLEAYKANKLRKFLSKSKGVSELIDFQNYYVFRGIGITTCIIQFQKIKKSKALHFYKLLADTLESYDLGTILDDPRIFEHIKFDQKKLGESPWSFASGAKANLNGKIDGNGDALDKVLLVGQGMATGRNKAFGEISLGEILSWHLKPRNFIKRASNSDIQRYFIQDRHEFIIYPEDVARFEQLPKGIQRHLLMHRNLLKERAAYKRGNCEWWKYSWPLHKECYKRKKIVCPYLATQNRFAPVFNNEFISLTDTTVLFENGQPESLEYLLALLNSQLLTFRFRNIGKLKGGGIYEYFWNSISKLPIRRINFSDPAERAFHDKIVALVKRMLRLHGQLSKTKTPHQQDFVKRQVKDVDQRIDSMVYQLYSLTPEEIAIVEGRKEPIGLQARTPKTGARQIRRKTVESLKAKRPAHAKSGTGAKSRKRQMR